MIYRFISVLIFIFVIITIYYLVLCHIDDGPIGPKGERGDIGETGPQGRIGVKGLNGERGPIGNRGDPKINATEGPVGDLGKRGIQGDQGDRGETGGDGNRGLKGDVGDNGIPGEPGIQGVNGQIGKQGDDNKLKFILLDGSNYEKETDIETKDSTAFSDFLRPNPGQTYSPTDFNVKFGRGIPIISTNNTCSSLAQASSNKCLKCPLLVEDVSKRTGTKFHILFHQKCRSS